MRAHNPKSETMLQHSLHSRAEISRSLGGKKKNLKVLSEVFAEFDSAARQDGLELKFDKLEAAIEAKKAEGDIPRPVHFIYGEHRWTATVQHVVAGYTHDSGTRSMVYFINVILPSDMHARKCKDITVNECLASVATKLEYFDLAKCHSSAEYNAEKGRLQWHLWSADRSHCLAIKWEHGLPDGIRRPPLTQVEQDRNAARLMRAFTKKKVSPRMTPWQNRKAGERKGWGRHNFMQNTFVLGVCASFKLTQARKGAGIEFF